MHITASAPRLALEPHQMVHDRACVSAAIGHVAELHQMASSADPLAALVGEAGVAQHVGELVVVAMQVADDDHTLYAVPL